MNKLDAEGYPTKRALRKIRNWPIGKPGFWEFVADCLHPTYSTMEKYPMPYTIKWPSTKIEITTGGWSGSEEVMNEVMNHVYGRLYWAATFRGGRFDFEVPDEVL